MPNVTVTAQLIDYHDSVCGRIGSIMTYRRRLSDQIQQYELLIPFQVAK